MFVGGAEIKKERSEQDTPPSTRITQATTRTEIKLISFTCHYLIGRRFSFTISRKAISHLVSLSYNLPLSRTQWDKMIKRVGIRSLNNLLGGMSLSPVGWAGYKIFGVYGPWKNPAKGSYRRFVADPLCRVGAKAYANPSIERGRWDSIIMKQRIPCLPLGVSSVFWIWKRMRLLGFRLLMEMMACSLFMGISAFGQNNCNGDPSARWDKRDSANSEQAWASYSLPLCHGHRILVHYGSMHWMKERVGGGGCIQQVELSRAGSAQITRDWLSKRVSVRDLLQGRAEAEVTFQCADC